MAERQAPTPARLRRARREGDTPISPFAVRAASLTVVVLLLPSLGKAVQAAFDDTLRAALATPASAASTALVTETATLVVPALLAGAAAALAAGIAQTRLSLAWPRPPSLAARFFDGMRAYDVARSVIFFSALVFTGGYVVARQMPLLASATGKSGALLEQAGSLGFSVAWHCLTVVAALAALDVVIRRAAWLRRLSPSPEEAKRERRQSEGDPEARRARRRAHEAVARGEPS